MEQLLLQANLFVAEPDILL